MSKKFKFMGMPVEVRSYVAPDEVILVKKGKANIVIRKDGKSLTEIIDYPEVAVMKVKPQPEASDE